jgi:SAM-dependent methyltransferase
MLWTIAPVLAGLILVAFLALPMGVARRYGLEGPETLESVAAYDRTSRWPFFALERWMIMRHVARLRPQGKLLDVGCGPGYLAARIAASFPAVGVLGLDIDSRNFPFIRRNWGAKFVNLAFLQADAQRLPFGDASLDVIVSSLSMHHWPDVPAALAEFHRTLRPGGELLIWDVRRNAPRFFYYGLVLMQVCLTPPGIRRSNGARGSFWAAYTPSELRALTARTPFKQVTIQSGLGWAALKASKAG